MTNKFFQLRLLQPVVLTFLFAIFFFNSSFAGGDHYEIYLNKKLLSKQLSTQNMSTLSLQLGKLNYNDEITIYYSHCGITGKKRSLALKDKDGKVLKEWKFEDSKNSAAMTIHAKDIIELQIKTGDFMLFYTAKELPKGRTLASLNCNTKSMAGHQDSPCIDKGIAHVQHSFIKSVYI